MNWYRRLVIAAGIVAYILIIVGAIVRVEGAGLGCGDDWPVCNGEVVPTFSYLTTLEYTHRIIASIVVMLTTALLIAGWRVRTRSVLFVLLPAIGLVLVLTQAGLGAVTVVVELDPGVVTAHLGMAQMYLAVILVAGLVAYGNRISTATGFTLGQHWSRFGPFAIVAGVAVFVLMLTGGYTATSDAAWACPEWPACNGNYVPTGVSAVDIHLVHRWIALIALASVAVMLVQALRIRRDSPAITGLATAVAALMAAQIFVGAANIWFELASWVSATHLGVATLIWAGLVALTVLDRMMPVTELSPASSTPTRRPLREVVADYYTTTKPGVLVLLLITTLVAMLVATVGWPSPRILFWTLVGGALSAGGAGAINHYVDRDIDSLMTRTRNRPIPQGRIEPVHVLFFGIVLSVLAVMVLSSFVNPLAAMIALSGNLFYVFVYTMWLKRLTPQNIVIGGAAGAVPPMVGWAAVTGSIGVPALLMFGFIFLWTPPHFWALALFKRTDYAIAGVPMLPAVRGEEETRKQILLYSILMVGASLLIAATGVLGLFYLAVAGSLGALFIYRAYQLRRLPSDGAARGLFFYSMIYLGLVFMAMVADRVIAAAI